MSAACAKVKGSVCSVAFLAIKNEKREGKTGNMARELLQDVQNVNVDRSGSKR
jgi:hypothetical protein